MAFDRAMGGELRSMGLEERLAAGRAWDGVFMLLQAMARAGAPPPEMSRRALEHRSHPYYGVSGIFLPDGNCHTRQLSRWLLVRSWRNGAWRSPVAHGGAGRGEDHHLPDTSPPEGPGRLGQGGAGGGHVVHQ